MTAQNPTLRFAQRCSRTDGASFARLAVPGPVLRPALSPLCWVGARMLLQMLRCPLEKAYYSELWCALWQGARACTTKVHVSGGTWCTDLLGASGVFRARSVTSDIHLLSRLTPFPVVRHEAPATSRFGRRTRSQLC